MCGWGGVCMGLYLIFYITKQMNKWEKKNQKRYICFQVEQYLIHKESRLEKPYP